MHYSIMVLRSLVFYLVFAAFCLAFCLTAVFFIWFLPFNTKFSYLANWNRITIFLTKYLAGIDYKVTGLENIPKEGTFVVLAKHQSQWETYFLLLLFYPVSLILKRELLKIPGFGWGLRMMKTIPIDRSNPKQALKQIQTTGLIRLKEDKLPVLIFPEGTRIAWGKSGKYARSGAALAISADVPLILISHNAGYFWPADTFLKKPGIVEVIISEPIYPNGKTALELTSEAEKWIEANIREPLIK
jgi:1-acyl-sn-glycerol-3-phosphate acyltransferase